MKDAKAKDAAITEISQKMKATHRIFFWKLQNCWGTHGEDLLLGEICFSGERDDCCFDCCFAPQFTLFLVGLSMLQHAKCSQHWHSIPRINRKHEPWPFWCLQWWYFEHLIIWEPPNWLYPWTSAFSSSALRIFLSLVNPPYLLQFASGVDRQERPHRGGFCGRHAHCENGGRLLWLRWHPRGGQRWNWGGAREGFVANLVGMWTWGWNNGGIMGFCGIYIDVFIGFDRIFIYWGFVVKMVEDFLWLFIFIYGNLIGIVATGVYIINHMMFGISVCFGEFKP